MRVLIACVILCGAAMGTPTGDAVKNEMIGGDVKRIEEPAPVEADSLSLDDLGMYTITAYCSCARCCGKSDGITASGAQATVGRTVAAPKSFPFGTRLYIDGLGERIVEDRGGSIKGNRLDVYFGSHEEALEFGRKELRVYKIRED